MKGTPILPAFFFLLLLFTVIGMGRDGVYVIDRAQPRGRGMALTRWYGACYDASIYVWTQLV